mmetsp:Transcript_72187/g.233556  ORF Transcript_72187/g.233556 Transcript_72187/m.233556 type:complete len:213 (+) Transcript_72187:112-750(+)
MHTDVHTNLLKSSLDMTLEKQPPLPLALPLELPGVCRPDASGARSLEWALARRGSAAARPHASEGLRPLAPRLLLRCPLPGLHLPLPGPGEVAQVAALAGLAFLAAPGLPRVLAREAAAEGMAGGAHGRHGHVILLHVGDGRAEAAGRVARRHVVLHVGDGHAVAAGRLALRHEGRWRRRRHHCLVKRHHVHHVGLKDRGQGQRVVAWFRRG